MKQWVFNHVDTVVTCTCGNSFHTHLPPSPPVRCADVCSPPPVLHGQAEDPSIDRRPRRRSRLATAARAPSK